MHKCIAHIDLENILTSIKLICVKKFHKNPLKTKKTGKRQKIKKSSHGSSDVKGAVVTQNAQTTKLQIDRGNLFCKNCLSFYGEFERIKRFFKTVFERFL